MLEKIEAGRWYKMRNGEKAWINSIVQDRYYPFLGAMLNKGQQIPMRWASANHYYSGGESCYDLISLWQEPNEVKLPEKMREPDTWTIENNLCDAAARVDINQIIDFCESLQVRVKELELELIAVKKHALKRECGK